MKSVGWPESEPAFPLPNIGWDAIFPGINPSARVGSEEGSNKILLEN